MKKNYIVKIFSILFLISSAVFGQSTGKIMGKVIDQDTGEGIPFANVFVEGTSLGAASDVDGNFVILNIPPAVYSVTASYIGYQKVTRTNVRVNVGFTTAIDFQLPSGAVEMDAVIVQGERNPLIRQDLTNPTVAINSETIDALPVDNISEVVKLQAGVVQDDDGALHVRGGRSNEVAYQINGLSINDPYGNTRSVGVATNAVQEVSVSTGTFSAEFGNALSGVINYVTKEGGEDYSFSLRGYTGEYVSSNSDVFNNIEDFDPVNTNRFEGTFGGKIPFSDNTKFFISGIYSKSKGLYYGQRIYNPTDSYLIAEAFAEGDPRQGGALDPYYFNPFFDNSNGLPTGDRNLVAMDPSMSWNLQANISHNFGSLIKLKYEIVADNSESKDFDRSFLFNPDGLGKDYSQGIIHSLDLTHTINNSTFYTLKASYSQNKAQYYLYEDINDPRYLPGFFRKAIGTTLYLAGGTSNYRSERETQTLSIKGDIVSQMFNIHEVKAGFEYRKHKLFREAYSIEFFRPDGIPVSLSDVIERGFDLKDAFRIPVYEVDNFEKEPVQFAAYVQDKIELAKTLILNAGLRYEYFDPASQYNPELSKNIDEDRAGFIDKYDEDAEVKHMISPRFSVSYPITDRGVIRFSYGHFYQIGSLSTLYRNDMRFVQNTSTIPRFGNANVNPERSVQYEIGLQQQLTEDFKFDLTGFYKDVRDYIYTQTIYSERARQYSVLTNLAYANVKGITLSFIKRPSPGGIFSATLDYTYQVAEGNRTEPEEDLYFSVAAGKQTETYLVPLDFDRSHLINGTVTLSDPRNWAVGIIYNMQTGSPYTPVEIQTAKTITYEQASAVKPFQWNVDLKLEKFFRIDPFDLSVFVQVKNLFDTENERFVWSNSGQALENADSKIAAVQYADVYRRTLEDKGMFDPSVIENYYKREERLSIPREIRLGFSIIFD
ncbi:MAG: TonB-dependent receptor [Ignavibacteriales bacterium]|nr:TonB-dependent receptor [Ignavibacteriales bacterium]MCB9210629.1 TonB-dependent receptor [Ignavibacteriales bacterium]MCB9259227.1 TonB-dependent receptor [Ignavibacteriales bacterium]